MRLLLIRALRIPLVCASAELDSNGNKLKERQQSTAWMLPPPPLLPPLQ